jgi:putative DNA primase/helicase
MANTTLDLARNYLAKGFSIIPLKPKSKKPAIESWKEFQGRRPTEEEIRQWFDNRSKNNIGIVTGRISGIAVIDFDSPAAIQFAKDQAFPPTPTARTGNGFHGYFQYREGTRNFQKRDDLPGLDLRGDGGYVVGPPSIHESGRAYTWLPGQSLEDLPLAPLPEIILIKNQKEKTPLREAYKGAKEGTRNETLARLAGSWVSDGLTIKECMEQAAIWNQKNSPPLPDREIEQTVKSIFTKDHQEREQKKEPEKFEIGINLTDLGNARRLIMAHSKDLRFCYPCGKWLAWDGQRWKIDDTGEIYRRAKDTVRLMYEEAGAEIDERRRKQIGSYALKSESDTKIKAMLSLAQSEPGIPILPEDMDKDPWVLNVANGTIDLKTGCIKAHRRENLITKLASVEYWPDAECPFWLEHLEKIFQGNVGLISFLGLGIGYSLTGITDERVMFISHGTGANGKTTTHEVIAQILGDYAVRTPTESILIKRDPGIPNDLAKLKGARFVYCSEVEEGKRMAESLIKDLTGNDTISARFMRGEWFTFQPSCKLWIATNHKPGIRGTENAIWDRIRLIPFNVSIPQCDRIPRSRMMERLTPEFPGILAWAVQGCKEWIQFGLQTPDEVKEATEGYRGEMDVVGEFIDERCIISKMATASAKDLYESYVKWAEGSGERPVPQRTFGLRLTERGFYNERTTRGRHRWVGIGVENDTKDEKGLF